MLLWPFNKYPGTDYETFNWEWILKTIKEWVKTMADVKNSIEEFMDHGFKDALYDLILKHPEWVTTVMDGSLSLDKFMNSEKLKILRYSVTPQMYGAAADGVTDDTQAFNDMFADTDEFFFFIPPGEYKIDGNISCNRSDVTVFGAGEKSVLSFTSGGFMKSGNGCLFEKFMIDGGAGIYSTSGYHNTYRSVYVTNADYGFRGVNAYINQFETCYFTYNKIGVRLTDQSYETVFTDCAIDNNMIGVYIDGNTSGPVFKGCTIEGNRNTATNFGLGVFITTTNTRVVFDGCWFESNGTYSESCDVYVDVSPAVRDKSDLNNHIQIATGETSPALHGGGAGKVTIQNCTFWATPRGIMSGGSNIDHIIVNNKFGGVLGRGNQPVVINTVTATQNKIWCENNKILNTDNAAIETEMLQGVCGSYIYFDNNITNTTWIAQLRTGVVYLDGHPLFVARVRISALADSTVTPLKPYAGTGTFHPALGYHQNDSGFYEGATTIYATTDGTFDTNNVFPAADVEYTYTVICTSGARRNTTNGWKTANPVGPEQYAVNKDTSTVRTLLTNNYAILKALVIYGTNDSLKVKQALAVTFTDLW